MFALADLHRYFQYRGDERLPRLSTSCGRINTHLMGNMCVADETASIVWKGWNIDLCPAELQSRLQGGEEEGGGRPADPRQAVSLSVHTWAANTALLEQTHVEARVWQWHLHSLLNSSSHPNMRAQTHMHRCQRPRGEEEEHQSI